MTLSEREEPRRDLPAVSPRFGFELTPAMARALGPALEDFDSWEDNPVETLEIAVRDEVGLAHTLNYNVAESSALKKDVTREFSRSNGVWVEGFISPDARQYIECEAEMESTGNLEASLHPHEAMVDGSLIYEANPWAVPYLLQIWDSKQTFHSFLGWFSQQDSTEKFTIHDLDPGEGANLANVIKELTSGRISSDEQQRLMVALELAADRAVSAEEILEFFAEH
jgi:hypothetical protein